MSRFPRPVSRRPKTQDATARPDTSIGRHRIDRRLAKANHERARPASVHASARRGEERRRDV